MAFRFSEIRMILTARNEASRTFRRVARDLGSLDNITNLRNRAKDLSIQREKLLISQKNAAAEVESFRNGTKQLERANALRNAETALTRARAAQVKLARDGVLNLERQLQTSIQLTRNAQRLKDADLDANRRRMIEAQQSRLMLTQSRLRAEQAAIVGPQLAGRRSDITSREAAVTAAANAYRRLGRDAGLAAEKQRVIGNEVARTTERLRQNAEAQRALKWTSLEQGSRIASHFGRILATTGLIATASLGLASKSAADFSTQANRAATQARQIGQPAEATARIANRVMDTVLQQMQRFPATSEEMANSFYEIFSGTNVQSVKEATRLVELFNMAAVAGTVDLGTMTDAALTLFNNFTEGANRTEQLEIMLNDFLAAVRFGRTTVPQFANSLANVVPFAKQAGLQFRDVADAMAVLTRATGGRFTSRDATGLFRQIELLSRPEVVAGLHKMGVEVQDLRTGKMRPLMDVLTDINERLVKTGKFRPGPELLNFFKEVSRVGGAGEGSVGLQGTAQARRTFAFLIQNMDEYHQVSGLIHRDNDQFIKDFDAMSKTPGVQWDIMINQLKSVALTIGRDAIPAFTNLLRPLGDLLHAFNSLSPATKQAIASLLVYASVGALVLGPVVALAGGIITLIAHFRTLRRWSGGGAGIEKVASGAVVGAAAFKNLARETGYTRIGMIGLMATLLTGIPVLVKFRDQLLQLTTGAQGLEGALKAILILLGGFALSAALTRVLKLVATFGTMTRSATAAGFAVGALLGKLKLLRGPFIATIVLEVLLNLDKIEALGDRVFGALGLGPDKLDLEDIMGQSDKLRKRFGTEKFVEILEKTLFASGQSPSTIMRRAIGEMGDAVDEMVPDFIRKWQARQAEIAAVGKQLVGGPVGVGELADARKWSQGNLSAKQYLATLKHISELEAAARAATTPEDARVKWQAYAKAVNAANAKLTDLQKQTMNEVLATFQQTGTISDANFRSRWSQIQALKQAAEKSGDFATAKRAAKMEADLRAKATSEQLAAIETVSSATTEEAKLSQAAFDKEYKRVQQLKKLAEKTHNIEDIRKFQKAQEDLSAHSESFMMQAAEQRDQYLDELHQKELDRLKEEAAQRKRNAENAKEAIKSMTDNIMGIYESALQRNRSQLGELFGGPFMQSGQMADRLRFGFRARPTDLLRDVREAAQNFVTFRSSLDRLAAKGAPEELISQLKELGPESQKNIDTLLRMSPGMFANYVKAFKRGQTEAEAAARQDLQAQLDKWARFGKQVALAIARGVRSENVALETELRNMILRMFPGLASQAGATPQTAPQPKTVNFTWNGQVLGKEEIATQMKNGLFAYRTKAPLE
jgi:hypothetical protein